MPRAPLCGARVAVAYSPFGTRAIGAMPASSAAVAICAQASSDITPCSMSRNSQSNPETVIALAISTLRVMRMPTPSDKLPCSSFSRATLRTGAGMAVAPLAVGLVGALLGLAAVDGELVAVEVAAIAGIGVGPEAARTHRAFIL